MPGKSRSCPERTKLLASRTPLVVVEYVRNSETIGVADCDAAAWKHQVCREAAWACKRSDRTSCLRRAAFVVRPKIREGRRARRGRCGRRHNRRLRRGGAM
eukprot:scaffold26118_cov47-Phaeocystis_antarctica.AAC.4